MRHVRHPARDLRLVGAAQLQAKSEVAAD